MSAAASSRAATPAPECQRFGLITFGPNVRLHAHDGLVCEVIPLASKEGQLVVTAVRRFSAEGQPETLTARHLRHIPLGAAIRYLRNPLSVDRDPPLCEGQATGQELR